MGFQVEKELLWDININERSDESEIQKQVNAISSNFNLTSLLEIMPHMVIILNTHRQIVWANKIVLSRLEKECIQDIAGFRPGEILNCVNAFMTEGGCGTYRDCVACGALQAIMSSLEGNGIEKECTIRTKDNKALNLQIKACLVDIENHSFDIVSILDMNDKSQRRILERVFFHDIMNVAGAVQGFMDILPEMIQDNSDELPDILTVLSNSAGDLIELIKFQKDLLAAENNEFSVHMKDIDIEKFLADIRQFFKRQLAFDNRRIELQSTNEDFHFKCDKRILKRIIVNAIKNALEATEETQVIQVRCRVNSDIIVFEIQSDSYIPPEIQSRIFQKSFSTKGQGRGIGTYSIKLFTEKHLNGKVWFESDENSGTTFFIQVPNLKSIPG